MNNFIYSCFSMPWDTKLLRQLCFGKHVGNWSINVIIVVTRIRMYSSEVEYVFMIFLCLQGFVDLFLFSFFCLGFFFFGLFWFFFRFCCCCFDFLHTVVYWCFNLAAYCFSNNVQNLFLNGKSFLKWCYTIHRKIDNCSFHVNVITYFYFSLKFS